MLLIIPFDGTESVITFTDCTRISGKKISLDVYNFCTGCLLTKEVPIIADTDNSIRIAWSKDFLELDSGTYRGVININCRPCEKFNIIKLGCANNIIDMKTDTMSNCSDIDCSKHCECECDECCDDDVVIRSKFKKEREEIKLHKLEPFKKCKDCDEYEDTNDKAARIQRQDDEDSKLSSGRDK